MSKSARLVDRSLSMRREYARGSPKPARHIVANSTTSGRDVNSPRAGIRNGSGSR
jgi:hypothetical protein